MSLNGLDQATMDRHNAAIQRGESIIADIVGSENAGLILRRLRSQDIVLTSISELDRLLSLEWRVQTFSEMLQKRNAELDARPWYRKIL